MRFVLFCNVAAASTGLFFCGLTGFTTGAVGCLVWYLLSWLMCFRLINRACK